MTNKDKNKRHIDAKDIINDLEKATTSHSRQKQPLTFKKEITPQKMLELSKEDLIKLLILADKKASEQDMVIFEMRSLLQSGKGLGDLLNLPNLLHTFMAIMRERYNTINSTILLLDDSDPNSRKFNVKAYHGLPDTYLDNGQEEELGLFNLTDKDGLLWQIIRQGDAFSVEDLRGKPRFKVAWETYNLDVLQSAIWCPLIKKGEVKGILTLGLCRDGTQIPLSERSFLQDLASIAVTNIDAVLKYEKNETILNNIRMLYDINQHLANVNDFKNLCVEILKSAVHALKAQKGNLMLLNEQTGELEIKVVWGDLPSSVIEQINSGELQTTSFKIGEGIAGLSASKKKPIRVNDRKRIKQIGNNTVYALLTAPILKGDHVVGVLNMTNKVQPHENKLVIDKLGQFTEDDETLLVGLADQAAGNLHKSKLYSASITDKLTSLFNKRHFDLEASRCLDESHKHKQELSLIVMDIDHFKHFNDTHGHKAGDCVLIEIGAELRKFTTDLPYLPFRYGGEEFCILLPNTSSKKAHHIIEKFRQRIEKKRIKYEKKVLNVTISIGIASYPTDCQTETELFKLADEALYASKENGRNQTQCYNKLKTQKKSS